MALLTITRFLAIGPGQQATMPHYLVNNGVAMRPDLVSFSIAGPNFSYVSCDSLSITVQNNGSTAGSCDVLCMSFAAVGLEPTFPSPYVTGSMTGTVKTDGVLIIGTGSPANPVTLGQVIPDGITIAGLGTAASPLVALGSAGTTIYFNILAYGGNGNGSFNNNTAFLNADAAAGVVGGGTIWMPNGVFAVGERGNSLQCISLHANVSILGQSKANSIIFQIPGQRTSVRVIYCVAGSGNASFSNFTIDGNSAGQGAFDEHKVAIFMDNTNWFHIEDIEIKNSMGTSIAVWQNSSNVLVSHVYAHDCQWIGISFGDTAGQKNCAVRDSRFERTASGVHVESNGVVGPTDNILIERVYCDGSTGNAAFEVVGGTAPSLWASNVTMIACQVVGFVFISGAQNINLLDSDITNSDTNVAPNQRAAVRVTGEGANILIQGNTITQTSTGTAIQAVQVAGTAVGDTISGVKILDNTIFVQGTTLLGNAGDGILIQTVINARVERNDIFGNAGITGTFYGVNVNAKLARNIDWTIVNDNYIVDFPIGIGAQSGSGTIKINALITSRNLFETPGGNMTACLSLDADNHHAVLQSTAIGNDRIGNITMWGTFPNCPVLIGGNRGGGGQYLCAGSPNGQITDIQGSMAFQRDAASAGLVSWVNFGGTINGWHSVNVT